MEKTNKKETEVLVDAKEEKIKEEKIPLENREIILGKVLNVLRSCPNPFDWDECIDQLKCPFYQLCDRIEGVQDISLVLKEKKGFWDKLFSTEKFIKDPEIRQFDSK